MLSYPFITRVIKYSKALFHSAFFSKYCSAHLPGGDSDDSIKHTNEENCHVDVAELKAHDLKSEESAADWYTWGSSGATSTTNL